MSELESVENTVQKKAVIEEVKELKLTQNVDFNKAEVDCTLCNHSEEEKHQKPNNPKRTNSESLLQKPKKQAQLTSFFLKQQ